MWLRSGLIICGALLGIIGLTHINQFDVWLSDLAFDFQSGTWAIDHATSFWRPVLYDGPKALIIVFALVLLASFFRARRMKRLGFARREAIFLLLCLAIVPGVIGLIRSQSGVSCPRALQHYGGQIEDEFGQFDLVRFFQLDQPGKCWPSGHASGGFALLSLAFLNRAKLIRVQFAILSLGVGSAMGGYQILRGAHYPSHVLVTLLMALAIVQFARIAVYIRAE